MFSKTNLLTSLFWSLILAVLPSAAAFAAPGGKLILQVVDAETNRPIAVRMHLKNRAGRPIKPRNSVSWKEHFVFDGEIVLNLAAGDYTFEMEAGPEYRLRTGNFSVGKKAEETKQVSMKRFVNMKKEGWWSGDLHIHRPVEDIEILMRANDLHIAPVITWWANRKSYRNFWLRKEAPADLIYRFEKNRFFSLMAGEDERQAGALLYFGLDEPLPMAGSKAEYPSPVEFLRMAKKHDHVHVDIEKPFWWDMPVWVASGMCDSIGLCNNHQWRDGMLQTEAWGKPRNLAQYPNPHGNGRWSQDIYYHLLNCGLHIPPSAGSASGVIPNPVGYNRVYVYCGPKLEYETWWENLRAGKVVVTNGPMLIPRVNGKLPGHVFASQDGQPVSLEIQLKMFLRDQVEHLEIVQDGRVVQSVKLQQWANNNGKLPPVVFQQSGWMLIRAVTNNPKTYRFASTGPYYVEIDGRPKISKASAQFFVDWVVERAGQIKLADDSEHQSVMKYHRQARDFWQQLLDKANAD